MAFVVIKTGVTPREHATWNPVGLWEFALKEMDAHQCSRRHDAEHVRDQFDEPTEVVEID